MGTVREIKSSPSASVSSRAANPTKALLYGVSVV